MSVLSSRWRPALRMARRDLWRHKGRTLLTMFLVALPVLVGVAVAEFHHNTQWEGERAARSTMGGADAIVEVTPFQRTRVTYWPGDMGIRAGTFTRDAEGKRRPVHRRAAARGQPDHPGGGLPRRHPRHWRPRAGEDPGCLGPDGPGTGVRGGGGRSPGG